MKRIYFILSALCVCLLASAQSKKVEPFDRNTWHWTEHADQYQYVAVEDGNLVISNLKKNKKYSDYQNMAKSFAKLPLRPQDNFKLTIKYSVANYYITWYQILFNTSKQCLEDYEESGQFDTNMLLMMGPDWVLGIDDGSGKAPSGRLPGKVKAKGEYPMEFVLEKKHKKVSIEVNGIELFEGECEISNPCIGFWTSFTSKGYSTIKIDEIIIEQADADD